MTTPTYRLDQIDRYIAQYERAIERSTDPANLEYLRGELAKWEAARPAAAERAVNGVEPPASWAYKPLVERRKGA